MRCHRLLSNGLKKEGILGKLESREEREIR